MAWTFHQHWPGSCYDACLVKAAIKLVLRTPLIAWRASVMTLKSIKTATIQTWTADLVRTVIESFSMSFDDGPKLLSGFEVSGWDTWATQSLVTAWGWRNFTSSRANPVSSWIQKKKIGIFMQQASSVQKAEFFRAKVPALPLNEESSLVETYILDWQHSISCQKDERTLSTQ